MYWWIIYDISKDRARVRVAKRCKQLGLTRVQKSVFLGPLKSRHMDALKRELNQIVNWRTDKVFFVPTSPQDFKRILRTGPKKPPPMLPSPTAANFY